MKNKTTFTIESLLYGIDSLKGAITQVLFAQKVAKHEGLQSFNRLARITFNDPAINKAMPGAVKLEETLLIGYESWNDTELHLCMRGGTSTCRIATGSSASREITVHNDYAHAILQGKLSDSEITDIFYTVWDNSELIQPVPKYLED